MKPGEERYAGDAPGITAVSAALANWYSFRSSIRRLLAIEDANGLRFIVSLEPTIYGDDAFPVWFANCHTSRSELQKRIDLPVALELIVDPSLQQFEIVGEGTVVACLCWRDPCAL